MLKVTTFDFDGKQIKADVVFVQEHGRLGVLVKINDKELNSEFMKEQVVFPMADEGIFVREKTTDLRYDTLLDSISKMLVKEYPQEVKMVIRAT